MMGKLAFSGEKHNAIWRINFDESAPACGKKKTVSDYAGPVYDLGEP
jgi:hypothetical protein